LLHQSQRMNTKETEGGPWGRTRKGRETHGAKLSLEKEKERLVEKASGLEKKQRTGKGGGKKKKLGWEGGGGGGLEKSHHGGMVERPIKCLDEGQNMEKWGDGRSKHEVTSQTWKKKNSRPEGVKGDRVEGRPRVRNKIGEKGDRRKKRGKCNWTRTIGGTHRNGGKKMKPARAKQSKKVSKMPTQKS